MPALPPIVIMAVATLRVLMPCFQSKCFQGSIHTIFGRQQWLMGAKGWSRDFTDMEGGGWALAKHVPDSSGTSAQTQTAQNAPGLRPPGGTISGRMVLVQV
jgi:hypothetical protein